MKNQTILFSVIFPFFKSTVAGWIPIGSIFLFMFISNVLFGQQNNIFEQAVSISPNGNTSHDSAILDVESTDKGVLIPRMTSVQRNAISSPATGLLVFDTTIGSFWFYDGTLWKDLSVDDDWSSSGSDIYRPTGNAGIGLNMPMARLHVEDDQSQSITNAVVYGKYTATSNTQGVGVSGYSRPADFYGFGGKFEGGFKGVEGTVNPTGSNNYYGVYGQVVGGPGSNYGVYGYAFGTGTKYGVFGTATGPGTNYAGYFSGNAVVTVDLSVNDDLTVGDDASIDDLYVSDFSSFGGTSGSRVQILNNAVGRFYGPNTENIYLGYPSFSGTSYPNNGYVAVVDDVGTFEAGMYVNASGNGQIFADVKNFRMDHPEEADKEIWYACVEGPEAAAYSRGTATLANGEAEVTFPDHFTLVANAETMTVSLTPLSADSKGLAVVEKSETGFRVKELMSGTGGYSFDWEVKCVRKGYEGYRVVREKSELGVPVDLPVDNLESGTSRSEEGESAGRGEEE